MFSLMIELDSLSPEDTEYVLNLPYHLSEAEMSKTNTNF